MHAPDIFTYTPRARRCDTTARRRSSNKFQQQPGVGFLFRLPEGTQLHHGCNGSGCGSRTLQVPWLPRFAVVVADLPPAPRQTVTMGNRLSASTKNDLVKASLLGVQVGLAYVLYKAMTRAMNPNQEGVQAAKAVQQRMEARLQDAGVTDLNFDSYERLAMSVCHRRACDIAGLPCPDSFALPHSC